MQIRFAALRSILTAAVAAAAAVACSGDAVAPTSSSAANSSSLGSSDSARADSGSSRSSARIRLITRLAPLSGGAFARASGKAKWDSRNNNTKRELEIEVEDVPALTRVQFFVDGVRYGGTVTTDAYGEARVELSTQLGQTVPAVAAGATAEVRTTDGVIIVRGVFPTS